MQKKRKRQQQTVVIGPYYYEYYVSEVSLLQLVLIHLYNEFV